MLEEHQDPTMITMGVEPITCACHQIHSTPYAFAVDFKIMHAYMEQSTNTPSKEHKTTMFPVLCALLHHVRQ